MHGQRNATDTSSDLYALFPGRILVLSVCFFMLAAGMSAAIDFAPPPDWIVKIQIPVIKDYRESEIADGTYDLVSDTQRNIARREYYLHFARKIMSPVGVQHGSAVTVSFDPSYQKLVFHSVKLIRGGTVFDRMKKEEFRTVQAEEDRERFLYHGALNAILNIDDVRTGDVIEYAYTIIGENPVYHGRFTESFRTQFGVPLGSLYHRIIAPLDRTLQIHARTGAHEHVRSRAGDVAVYEWQQHDIPSVTAEDDVPAWVEQYPSVTVSEFRTWDEVREWAADLFAVSGGGGLLADTATRIAAQSPERTVRIRNALRFVQDEIRYLGFEDGIHGIKPRSPDAVLQRRFGDCKEKSLLLVALLGSMGIHSYPALVNTYRQHTVIDQQPNPNAFNHCIVTVPVGGNDFWYDPTIRHQGGKYDMVYCPPYGAALVLNSGTGGMKQMRQTAGTHRMEISESVIMDRINADANLWVTTRAFGHEADEQRDYFARYDRKSIEKRYLDFYANLYGEVENNGNMEIIDEREDNTFIVIERYIIKQAWKKNTKAEHQISFSVHPKILKDRMRIPDSAARRQPYGIGTPCDIIQSIDISLPEEWSITPETNVVETLGIRYRYSAAYNNKTISLRYAFSLETNEIRADDFKAYVAALRSIDDTLGYSLSTALGNTGSGGHDDVQWPMVIGIFCVFLAVCFGAYRLWIYDPAPPDIIEAPVRALLGWTSVSIAVLGIDILLMGLKLFFSGYFSAETWGTYVNPGSYYFNLAWVFSAVLDASFMVLLIVFSALLIELGMKRRSSFPRLFIIYRWVALVAVAVHAAIMVLCGLERAGNTAWVYTDTGWMGANALLWTLYYIFSEDAKRIFQERKSE